MEVVEEPVQTPPAAVVSVDASRLKPAVPEAASISKPARSTVDVAESRVPTVRVPMEPAPAPQARLFVLVCALTSKPTPTTAEPAETSVPQVLHAATEHASVRQANVYATGLVLPTIPRAIVEPAATSAPKVQVANARIRPTLTDAQQVVCASALQAQRSVVASASTDARIATTVELATSNASLSTSVAALYVGPAPSIGEYAATNARTSKQIPSIVALVTTDVVLDKSAKVGPANVLPGNLCAAELAVTFRRIATIVAHVAPHAWPMRHAPTASAKPVLREPANAATPASIPKATTVTAVVVERVALVVQAAPTECACVRADNPHATALVELYKRTSTTVGLAETNVRVEQAVPMVCVCAQVVSLPAAVHARTYKPTTPTAALVEKHVRAEQVVKVELVSVLPVKPFATVFARACKPTRQTVGPVAKLVRPLNVVSAVCA